MLRIGIVGAGRMGAYHAGLLEAVGGVSIAGAYDANPDAARALAEKHGAAVFPDSRSLAESGSVDAVVISSPTPSHFQQAMEALRAGKHVLCEKPLCRRLEDAEELLRAADGFKGVFMTGFKKRQDPAIQIMRRHVEEGLLGTPRFCNTSMMLGCYKRLKGDWFADFDACGGVILDMLSHHFDTLNWFFGPADRVFAASLMLDPALPEPTDYVSATVTHKNGVICNVKSCWARFGHNTDFTEVYGDEAAISYDTGSGRLVLHAKNAEPKEIPYEKADFMALQAREFVECVRSGGRPKASLLEGFESLRLASAVIESSQTGKMIRLK